MKCFDVVLDVETAVDGEIRTQLTMVVSCYLNRESSG